MIRKVAGAVVLAVVVIVWFVALRPTALGGPATYIIVSGSSMEPTYSGGDLVVLHAKPAYEVGDVVTFPVPAGEPGEGALVVHRIVGGSPEAFQTRGDNNRWVDEWRPAAGDVLGSEWFRVPSAGTVLRHAMDPALLAAVLGGLTATFVLVRRPGGRPGRSEARDEKQSVGHVVTEEKELEDA
jgi:signal peptidase I